MEDGNTSLHTISSDAAPIYPIRANHVIDSWCYSFHNTRMTPLIRFEYGLKEWYRTQSEVSLLISDIGQTLSIESHYTKLAIITEQENQRLLDDVKSAPLDQRISTYESIFEPKEAIDLNEVFERQELKEALQKRILMQGAAGIGKSTLCQKIAYEWAKGDLWSEFKTLFWIKFRNVNNDRYPSNNEHTLNEVIERECNLPEGSLAKANQDKQTTLIILDGYDELQGNQQFATSKGRFPILKAFQEEYPHLILTTRPLSQNPFSQAVKIEILGFDSPAISSYIDRFFPAEKSYEKKVLLKQLKNPLIYSLCHIPINLEIFCSLAIKGQTINENNTPTLTAIYTELTDYLIERFGKQRFEEISFRNTESAEEVDAHEFIHHFLEAIAWKMMEENTLYIANSEVQNIMRSYHFRGNLAQKIKKSQIGPLRFDQREGCFVHLTFQEFFAAKYLEKLFLQNESQGKAVVMAKKSQPRYRLVLGMTAGLLAKNKQKLKKYFEFCEAEEDLELALYCLNECGKNIGTIPSIERIINIPGALDKKLSLFKGQRLLSVNELPVHLYLVSANQTDALYWLLQKKSQLIYKEDADGRTIFLRAAYNGNIELMQFLYDQPRGREFLQKRLKGGSTPFIAASIRGHLASMEWLYNKDRSLLHKNWDDGGTPFHAAARGGHVPTMEWLYSKDATLLHKSRNDGATPFYTAAGGGHVDAMQWLYSKDATLLHKSRNDGFTPFHFAAGGGHVAAMDWLLELKGAFLNDRIKGQTSLHLAAQEGQINAIQWLYNKKPSILSMFDEDNLTPFHSACAKGQINALEWLYDKKPNLISSFQTDGYTPFHSAASGGHVDAMQWLYQKSPSLIRKKKINGATVLHVTAEQGKLEATKWLVNKDPSLLQERMSIGWTPLDIAVHNNQESTVAWLKQIQ